MITANENHLPLGMMCRMVSVSRIGYFDWKHRPHSDIDKANQFLANEIMRIFDDEKGRLGSPRITRRLQEEGKSASRHRVARIKRNNGWGAKATKKYKATTNSNHSLPVAPHLLEKYFTADALDQKSLGYNHYSDGRRLAVFGGCA
jgi:putative transposase